MSIVLTGIPTRQFNLAIFLSVCSILLIALYSVLAMGFEPCPLCITQQFFFLLVGLLSVIAFIHNPNVRGTRLYAVFIGVAAVAGASVAARQLWLQSLSEDLVPACGPSLEYVLNVFPFNDLLKALFMGDGNCAEIHWTLMGLSMAGWAFFWFSIFLLTSMYVLSKPRCKASNKAV
jgi:protein dithiol:quinone oxidoreductase